MVVQYTYTYYLMYLDFCLHFHCYIHNISVIVSFCLQRFLVQQKQNT